MTAPDQEEVEAVAAHLFDQVDDWNTLDTQSLIELLIEALDRHRAAKGIVPNYMERVGWFDEKSLTDPAASHHTYRQDRFDDYYTVPVYRFKTQEPVMSETAREAASQSVATAIAKADGWQLPKGDLNTLLDDIKRTYLAQADAAIDAYESELQRQSRDNDARGLPSVGEIVNVRATVEGFIKDELSSDIQVELCLARSDDAGCDYAYVQLRDVQRFNTQEQS